jgi:hypothetical protein
MSSLSRYVARITVRSIAAAMRDHGGGKQELIRLRPLARYGLRLIHFREGRIVPRTTTPRPRCRRVSIRTGGVYGPGTQTANPSELKTLQNMTSLRQIEANRRNASRMPVSPTCLPNGQGSARCSAFRCTDSAFEPSLYQRQSPLSGNAIFQGRDKNPEMAPAIQ